MLKLISENRAFDGVQRVYSHRSEACDCDMTFGLYLPAEAAFGPVPLLTYLSGLTCTHANAMEKSGAQRWAAEEGIAVLFPDTSPRGEGVPDDEAYDLGQGAGFYVNAQNAPWSSHFKMWDYITDDLHGALAELPVDLERQSITGHSMGGHGALTLAMHMPERYRAVSAFAPIANPTQSDWGIKQLGAYLPQTEWANHDASFLMAERGFAGPVLIDQGSEDQFLELLRPESLAHAMTARRQAGEFRMQKGYDHSYYFVSTFMADHIAFHAEALHG